LTLNPREVLGIVGESGSGKSVTALAVMGLLAKNAKITGSIHLGERELLGLKDRQMSSIRGLKIAMIFQDPLTSLNPVYSVGWQVEEAIAAHQDLSNEQCRAEAIRLLDLVGIPRAEDRIDDYPHEFSGGMRQRVVIAIAMANNPQIILADEPTTALDVTVQAQVLEALQVAINESHASLVLITHDLGVVAGLGSHRGDWHGRRGLLLARDALHPRIARFDPPRRRRRGSSPAPDPRLPALDDRYPTRLSVRSPVSAASGRLPDRGARAPCRIVHHRVRTASGRLPLRR
jgi:ABC-type dipeptide/oligopeptide/nickel transport system ATPase subunit